MGHETRVRRAQTNQATNLRSRGGWGAQYGPVCTDLPATTPTARHSLGGVFSAYSRRSFTLVSLIQGRELSQKIDPEVQSTGVMRERDEPSEWPEVARPRRQGAKQREVGTREKKGA